MSPALRSAGAFQNSGSSSGMTYQPLRIVCASPSSMARAASTNESAFLPAPRTDSAKARTSISSPVVVWDESLIMSEYSMTGNTGMPGTCRRNGSFAGPWPLTFFAPAAWRGKTVGPCPSLWGYPLKLVSGFPMDPG